MRIFICMLCFLTAVLLGISPAHAQSDEEGREKTEDVSKSEPTAEAIADAKNSEASKATLCEPVIVGGVEIVCLSRGVGSFTKIQRAKAIQGRIETLAEDRAFDSSRIALSQTDETVNIVADEVVILSLQEEDSSEVTSRGLIPAAQNILKRVQAAIVADRNLKSPNAIMWGFVKSAIATLALIALLFAFGWLMPRIHAKIDRSEGRTIRSLKIQSFELLNSNRITGFLHWLASALRILVTLLALYIYIPLVFSFFPWTASWSPRLFKYVVMPFVTLFHVVADYIPKLFFVIAIFLITRYLLKLIRFFFVEVGRGNLRFEGFYKEWADPTYKLVRVIVVAFAFVMAFPYLPGSHSPAFQGVSVFLGLLLSFGSSSAIANIVAGVVITYMRPFRIGDRVKIADTVGDVLEKNLLVTRVKTIKHVEITIPNSMVLGSHIVNYSTAASDEGLILNTTVTIGYDVPWRKVHELLLDAGKRTSKVDISKKMFVLQTALNDFYVSYELNAFTAFPNQMATIYSELHSNIQDAFNEAGVEIMSPHYGALRDGNGVAIPDSYKKSETES